MSKKILVVDDEPDIVRTLSIMLETEGYEVITAENGEDAIEMVYAEAPDLAIFDVVLPGINGKEATAILKRDIRYKKMPIILVTAQTQKRDEASLRESAADFYIIKPFDLYVLKDKIGELLRLKG